MITIINTGAFKNNLNNDTKANHSSLLTLLKLDINPEIVTYAAT
jgi:hypothetical protein